MRIVEIRIEDVCKEMAGELSPKIAEMGFELKCYTHLSVRNTIFAEIHQPDYHGYFPLPYRFDSIIPASYKGIPVYAYYTKAMTPKDEED